MSADCLKLKSYFGERDRTQQGLLGDELLQAYSDNQLQVSVLLRGVEGFGRLHGLHTDRLLTPSEDLPVVSVAVDERGRIESMLKTVKQIQRRGLIVVEGAQLLTGQIESVQLPNQLHEETKLTIYIGRRDRVNGVPAYIAITELLYRSGIAGATVLLGVDGTRAGRRLRARFFSRNENVPMIIVAVGIGDRIAELLPDLGAMLPAPLITLERTVVCKRDGRLLAVPHVLPRGDEHGLEPLQKLVVYTSQAATYDGRPINMQIVSRLRESNATGTTCIRGLWGFHGDHPPHGDRFFQLRRHVPVLTTVIDSPKRIARAFEIIDQLTDDHGLVTSESVSGMAAMNENEQRLQSPVRLD